jgi:hypothetical protein
MNAATTSFDTLLTEMSLALNLAAELEGELKTASFAAPDSRTIKMPRVAPPVAAVRGLGQAQPAR